MVKQVFLICQSCVTGDLDDAPPFVMITFSKKTLVDIAKYQVFMKTMTKSGLDPYKIKEFRYIVSFKNPCGHNPLNKEEAACIIFKDAETKTAWLNEFENPRVEGADSTLEELADMNNTPDCSMMGVKKEGVVFDAYAKHTSVLIDTSTIPNVILKKILKKLEA